MKSKTSWTLAAVFLAGSSFAAFAQTVTLLKNSPPPDGIVYGFQLMDGSLLYQGGDLLDWYRFYPDKTGSYVNGTYRLAASLPPDYAPYATSGGVLPDGRVLLIGGEYLEIKANYLTFKLTNKMAIYDPQADTWTEINPPAGADFEFIGDSQWTILANGKLLLGSKLTKSAALFDPKTMSWTQVSTLGKNDFNSEEGWTLMPDGSVFTADVKGWPHAERFLPNDNPSLSRWVSAGDTPVRLQTGDFNSEKAIPFDHGTRVYHPPGEIGPAILRPDGTVFATGGDCTRVGTGPNDCIDPTFVGHTAIYQPGTTLRARGTWTKGPNFPHREAAGDSFANLLPNGNVLVEANPAGFANDAFARYQRMKSHAIRPAIAAPTAQAPSTPEWHFYEYDGVNLNFEPNASFIGGQASTLLLPTGEVMLNGQAVYATTGTYQTSWAPTVTNSPAAIMPGKSYTVFGTQFNGLSQANAFGDELGVATNFPLVRITNNATGDIKYAVAHDASSMGVATGTAVVSTQFDVPGGIEKGASTLQVVANGIPSQPVPVMVGAIAVAGSAP